MTTVDPAPVLELSGIEKKHGVKATYFVQTKYVVDSVEAPMFEPQVFAMMSRLKKDGQEVASLGVSGTPELASTPLGTGVETSKNYRPEVGTHGRTGGATILGELHVSKTITRVVSPTPSKIARTISLKM